MIDEQLEFRLTQYLDGVLPAEEAAALFDELAKNPEAMAALDEYRKLDALLTATPVGIRWNALTEQISAHIDQDQQSLMRIGIFAAPVRIAIAALVLLAVGAGSWMMLRPVSAPGPGSPVAASITGPVAEAAPGVAIANIEIGGPELTDAGEFYIDLVTRPQRVIIASGVDDRQDERPF